MPSCQSINCTNTRGKCAKSFFEIPDPTKSKEKRKLCKLWIDHLRNDKLKLETFVYNRNKLVCEDHFELHYFERKEIAESEIRQNQIAFLIANTFLGGQHLLTISTWAPFFQCVNSINWWSFSDWMLTTTPHFFFWIFWFKIICN